MGVDNLVVVAAFPVGELVDGHARFLGAVDKVYFAVLMVGHLVIVDSMVVSDHQESLMAIVVVSDLGAYLPFVALVVDLVFDFAFVGGGAYLLVTCDVVVNAYLQEKQCVVVSVHLWVTYYVVVVVMVVAEDIESHDQACPLDSLDKELVPFVVGVPLDIEENFEQEIYLK